MKGTLTNICRAGLLASFIIITYAAMTSSMTLDLPELRNKVSKIKVNPRGKLWATGHFMGKKSIGSFTESAFGDVGVPAEVRAGQPVHRVKDLKTLLVQMLKAAQQMQQKHKLDIGDADPV